jgi:hypothetical protein
LNAAACTLSRLPEENVWEESAATSVDDPWELNTIPKNDRIITAATITVTILLILV